jgi:hypothetical protein
VIAAKDQRRIQTTGIVLSNVPCGECGFNAQMHSALPPIGRVLEQGAPCRLTRSDVLAAWIVYLGYPEREDRSEHYPSKHRITGAIYSELGRLRAGAKP